MGGGGGLYCVVIHVSTSSYLTNSVSCTIRLGVCMYGGGGGGGCIVW